MFKLQDNSPFEEYWIAQWKKDSINYHTNGLLKTFIYLNKNDFLLLFFFWFTILQFTNLQDLFVLLFACS